MQLDVVLPTHNRRTLLARALDSLLAADTPSSMTVLVTVVDNNSTDGTRELVQERAPDFGGRLGYLFEPRPGKPYALNSGIAATSGDLVGLIDDDEEVDRGWFRCIEREFADASLEFLGGPCLPRFEAEPPAWIGRYFRGVIGWVECGPEAREFSPAFPGILTGGNAVIARRLLERVGPYRTALNRSPRRLMGAEDEEMYHRLLRIGARGRYQPELIIYHHVPVGRMTRRYFRRWSFWCGVSRALIDAEHPSDVPHVAGIPRYLIGKAWRDALRTAYGTLTRRALPDERFASELNVWDLAGFVYGRHFYRGESAGAPLPAPREDRAGIHSA